MISIVLLIAVPALTAIILLMIPRKFPAIAAAVTLGGAIANFAVSLSSFGKTLYVSIPWAFYGVDLSFRLYHFSLIIIAAAAFFGLITALYCMAFLKGKRYCAPFLSSIMASMAFLNAAVAASNLVTMLFFWEGLLIMLFVLIASGGSQSFKAATKAFIIVGIGDLCLLVGVVILARISGNLDMARQGVATTGLGGVAFILILTGALGKAGSMPLHSWIPNAAIDAPLPFMALFPGALEKLVGIYFLTRVSLDIFKVTPNSWASITMMTVGAVTIIFAVMMALVQKGYKKLLSYHAISQVGYMVLGIGTALPVGIIGGLFHMLNNAIYKSCLFFTAGSVERQAGTTYTGKLGGLGRKMPVTCGAFLIAALSISGVPPFNGFFSKELVYDAALEAGPVFYIAALAGSFLTAASFLKLGHSVFFGKVHADISKIKDPPAVMLAPMVILASLCIFFGLSRAFPVDVLIAPVIREAAVSGHSFSGFPSNIMLISLTALVLVAAVLNHIYGVGKTGNPQTAVDHIHYAPGLASIYRAAEKRRFDPYSWGVVLFGFLSRALYAMDKACDFFYDRIVVRAAASLSVGIRMLHTGSYKHYIAWSLAAGAIIISILLRN